MNERKVEFIGSNYPDLIVKTKLQRPPLRKGIVTRKRLHEVLDQGLTKNLTLISAPAGFGKTTLTISWLTQQKYPVSWISLDSQDSNPGRFFTYLAAAISQENPELRSFFSEKMNSQISGTIQNMTEIILQEISTLSPFTIIVLDDFHLIIDEQIHQAMAYLLANLPAPTGCENGFTTGCHFMILTRSDPQFPLSRWRLSDELAEIRSTDLRFSMEETRNIFHKSMKINLSQEDIETLEEKTEGWVAGLQLAAISLKSLDSAGYSVYIRQMKGNNSLISDYLVEEVYTKLDDDLQSFLLQTSILERMSGPLCDAVAGFSGSQKILEGLEKTNVLVIPLDSERNWYRYHQLFSDVLLERLKNDERYSLEELHSRAAKWFEKNDIIEDSLKHWMAIGRYDHAARVIAQLSPKMMSNGQYFLLSNIIESFSEAAFETWPWLNIYLAWAYTFIKPDVVELLLVQAENVLQKESTQNRFSKNEIDEMQGNIATIWALIASRKGDFSTVAQYAPVALDLLPYETKKVRGCVLYTMATDHFMSLRFEQANKTYNEAYDLMLEDSNLVGCLNVAQKRVEILLGEGRLHEAETACKQALVLDHFYQGKELSMTHTLCANYGAILYEWNQVDRAFDYLERGCEKSRRSGITDRVYCASTLADIWLKLGELSKAEEILKPYIPLLGDGSITLWDDNHLAGSLIRLYARQGNTAELNRIFRDRQYLLGDVFDVIHAPAVLATAMSHYDLQDYSVSLEHAQLLESLMENNGMVGRQIEMLALMAASEIALGITDDAIRHLMKGLKLSLAEGYFSTYLDYGISMKETLQQMLDGGRHLPERLEMIYIRDLIDSFPSHAQSKTTIKKMKNISCGGNPEMLYQLTEHERKVLRLLIAGNNNKEIASHLCISINTVKTHIGNIYGKLDVHNRLEATLLVQKTGVFAIIF